MDSATPRPWELLRREPSVFDFGREPFADGIAGDFEDESRVIIQSPYVAWGRVEGDEDKPLRYAVAMSANLELIVTAVNDYDRLRAIEAAARAVVEALQRGEFNADLMRPEMVPAMDTLYALRAALEGSD